MSKAKEPQCNFHVELREQQGFTKLGYMSNAGWHLDPCRLLFMLSRYKFVAKMLSGKQNALEVGCGDGFATRMVLQEVPSIVAVDFDPLFVADINERMEDKWRFECRVHDMLSGPVEGLFESAYSLDVIEHIAKDREDLFLAISAPHSSQMAYS